MSSNDIQSIYSATSSLVDMKKAAMLGFTKKRLLKLIEMLTLHGIKIQHHFEFFKTSYSLPNDIDMVLVSTTNNSHACKGLVTEARKRQLPVVFIPDSKSKAKRILLKSGYKELTAIDVVPNIMQASEIMTSINLSSIISPTRLSAIPITQKEHKEVPKKTNKQEPKDDSQDILSIREASLVTNITERKIKDLINQSSISYIEQDDKIYVSKIEIQDAIKSVVQESDLTKEQEIELLLPIFLPIVAKDFNSFGYEYNRLFSQEHKNLLGMKRRPRIWRKALTRAREIIGVNLSVQYDTKKYRCTVDPIKYKEACVKYNLEGIELVESDHTTFTEPPKPQLAETKEDESMTQSKEESKTYKDHNLQQLIEEIRKKMVDQNIVRLEILPSAIHADIVKTVTLKF